MKELRRFLRREEPSQINRKQEHVLVSREVETGTALEPITPLGEESIRLLLHQYRNHLQRATMGSTMGSTDYFLWLQGWPTVGKNISDRREIDETAKAFQAADVLRNILVLLGQERIL